MKLISTLLLFFSTVVSANPIYISTQDELEKALSNLAAGEKLWILGGLADSIENQIIGEMAKENLWREKLKDWAPLAFEDYRSAVLNQGLSIIQTEVRREIAPYPFLEWLSPLGLETAEKEAFAEEFFFRFMQTEGGVYRVLLLQVGSPNNT